MNTIAQSFKIRCSAIGDICGGMRGGTWKEKIRDLESEIADRWTKIEAMKDGSKSKGNALTAYYKLCDELDLLQKNPPKYELPETAKTYCRQWLKEQIYDRRKEVSSKSMEWGNKVEFDALEYLAKHTGLGWVDKNTEKKENDFMTGCCDLWLPERKRIIDTKCSVDCFTFPLFDKKLPDVEYADQVQGYMELWGAESGAVSYVLMSAPAEWILKEARYKLEYGYTEAGYLEFAKKYNYDNFPPELRIKSFEFEKSVNRLEFISKRVDACRLYIQDLIDEMN